MFQIRRLSDPRLSARVCGSFGLDGKNVFAYAAFQKDEVLATAVFTLEEGCVVLEGADTGRRTDLPLIDGMARAAFAAQLRNGVAAARLGGRLPAELRHSLNKLGYAAEGSFSLQEFFEKKNCSHSDRKTKKDADFSSASFFFQDSLSRLDLVSPILYDLPDGLFQCNLPLPSGIRTQL